MGIGRSTLDFMLLEHAARPFRGNALTLGRQDIHFNMASLAQCARNAGVQLLEVPPEPSAKPELAARGNISDQSFFKALGFASLRALDISGYEGASVIWDLNRSGVPEAYRGAFDFILDGGTFEHVFHIPNALANLHDLVAVGGRIMHALPVSNYVDHGFYMFSPTLFCDYYLYNGYQLNGVLLHRIDRWGPNNSPGQFIEYIPAYFRNHQPGGIDGAVWNLFVTVTRTAQATSGKIPPQGYFYQVLTRS